MNRTHTNLHRHIHTIRYREGEEEEEEEDVGVLSDLAASDPWNGGVDSQILCWSRRASICVLHCRLYLVLLHLHHYSSPGRCLDGTLVDFLYTFYDSMLNSNVLCAYFSEFEFRLRYRDFRAYSLNILYVIFPSRLKFTSN